MRSKPDSAPAYAWKLFDLWATDNMLGELTEDWSPWWECWLAAWDDSREAYIEENLP
tara:strand:+ start:2907 stop:3077 length:171 start_codon:yes stop_codon:yes gene_type:complete